MVTTDLDRYRQIMTQLDDWKAFITEPPAVHGLSVLGTDVADGWNEVVDIAWHGVLTAVDHMLFIRDAGSADYPPSRVLSIPTACRGALLSASRTVWILSSSSAAVRRSRALSVEAEDARQAKNAVEEMASFLPDDEAVAEAVIEAIERLTKLKTRCKAAGLVLERPVDTDVVGAAAEHLSVQVAEVHAALALSWRSQSGYAHGYQWTGKSALTKPDLAEAVGAVAAAAIATNGALELFAQHLQLQGEEAPVATGAAGNA
jgi:hypothetical protein